MGLGLQIISTFALGDMNAWPDNDIALQEGMRRLKGLDYRPDRKEMLSLVNRGDRTEGQVH